MSEPSTDTPAPLLKPSLRLLVFAAVSATVFWMVTASLHIDLLHVQNVASARINADFAAFYGVVWACSALWVVASVPLPAVSRWLDRAAEHEARVRVGLALFAVAATVLFERTVLQGAQLLDDYKLYLLQADALSQGKIFLADIPAHEYVRNDFVLHLERGGERVMTGPYSMGQPLLLAAGYRLGVPNLTNFLAVGIVVVFTSRLVSELAGARAAVVAGVLVATSPMLIGIGATLHTAVPVTAIVVVGAWLAHRAATRSGSGWEGAGWTFGFGLLAGFAVHVRPIEGALLVGLGSLYVLWASERSVGALGRRVLLLFLGGLPAMVALAAYQHAVTGHPLSHPYVLLEGAFGEFYGFDAESNFSPDGHGARQAVTSAFSSWMHLSCWLFGGPVAFLALRHLGVAELRRYSVVLVFLAGHTVAYTLAHFGSILDFGSYYHLAVLPPLALLVGVGATAGGASRGAERESRESEESGRLLIAVTLAYLTFVPTEVWRLAEVSDGVRAPEEFVAENVEGPAVVMLITGYAVTQRNTDAVYYPPLAHSVDDDVIWLVPPNNEAIAEIMAAYPERHAYVLGFWPQGIQFDKLR